MQFYIGKSYVDRLVNRFALSLTQSRAGQFVLSRLVIPVTDADRVLRSFKKTLFATVNVTATGYVSLTTVPVGKRWIVHAGTVNNLTGTWTCTIIAVEDAGAVAIKVKTRASSASAFDYLPSDMPFELEAGDVIEMYVDTKGVNGTASLQLMYCEEDAY